MTEANSEVRFSVVVEGRADWPLNGTDAVIVRFKSPPVISVGWLRAWGYDLAETMGVNLGTHLHHADFLLTSDPEKVREWGIMPEHTDCHECITGVEAAVFGLEQDPHMTLAVGQCYWSPFPPGATDG